MEANTSVVAKNVVVGLDYILTVDDNILDSTEGSEPLEFIVGYQNIIPGLEQALIGMGCGESKDVLVKAVDAYGEFDPEAFTEIARNQFPQDMELEIDTPIRLRMQDGHSVIARIDSLDEENVRLNLNPPLAGKDLFFKASIASLRPATEDEIEAGRVGGCGGGCSSCGSGCCH